MNLEIYICIFYTIKQLQFRVNLTYISTLSFDVFLKGYIPFYSQIEWTCNFRLDFLHAIVFIKLFICYFLRFQCESWQTSFCLALIACLIGMTQVLLQTKYRLKMPRTNIT